MEIKSRQLEVVKRLLTYLDQYRNSGQSSRIPYEELLELKKVYSDIYQISNINISCSSCVLNYLQMLSAWYERESIILIEKEVITKKVIKQNKSEQYARQRKTNQEGSSVKSKRKN